MNLLVLKCDVYSDYVALQGFQWEAWGIQLACLAGETWTPIPVSLVAESSWNISLGLLGVVQGLDSIYCEGFGASTYVSFLSRTFFLVSDHFSPISSIPARPLLSVWAVCPHLLSWIRSVLREKPGQVLSVVLTRLLPFSKDHVPPASLFSRLISGPSRVFSSPVPPPPPPRVCNIYWLEA